MKIAIGVDHRGYELKKYLLTFSGIGSIGIEWQDVGAYSQERTDYPIYAIKVAQLIQSNAVEAGVLICGTGTGMAITANRFKNVYAGVAWDLQTARLNKEDDNVNVLVLPADFITHQEAYEFINIWLSSNFKGDRYAERIKLINDIRPY